MTQPNQYRPISITLILSRIIEKYIVKDHIYPCLTNPLIKCRFDDQFAFRPTVSPTSAIIHPTSLITFLLTSNKFVRLIASNSSKAFDTLTHSTLITNMALLKHDDSIHTSLISFFKNRNHSTKFFNRTSSALSINSSVVQGSVLGPSSFFIKASQSTSKKGLALSRLNSISRSLFDQRCSFRESKCELSYFSNHLVSNSRHF